MRRFLPVIIWLLVIGYWLLVLTSPVRADWLQDLFFGTENITKDLENANRGSLPLIDLIPAREPTPTGSGQPAARQAAQPQTTPSSTNDLLDLAGGYAVGCSLTSPCTTPVPNDLGSFFANLIGDLLGIRITGNDMATKYVEEGVPQGAALQVFQRLQKPGQDLAQSGDNKNPNVLGVSLLGYDPMKVAFGARKCQLEPYIPGSACAVLGTDTSLPLVTPTPFVQPSISTSPPSIGTVGSVIEMVNGITRSCPGAVVQKFNLTCLDSVIPSIPNQALYIMKLSADSYRNLQCVGFAQATQVLLWNGLMTRGGNAIDFAYNVPSGYQYINKNSSTIIKEGDVVIWDTRPLNPFGHIAMVSRVYDRNTFEICEANWGTPGKVQCGRTTYLIGTQIMGWLVKI